MLLATFTAADARANVWNPPDWFLETMAMGTEIAHPPGDTDQDTPGSCQVAYEGGDDYPGQPYGEWGRWRLEVCYRELPHGYVLCGNSGAAHYVPAPDVEPATNYDNYNCLVTVGNEFGPGKSWDFPEKVCQHHYQNFEGDTEGSYTHWSPYDCRPEAGGVCRVTPGDPNGDCVKDPQCAGTTATKTGTNGRDVLNGTARRDVIAAGGGNDVVRGLGGNDVICGGAGRDRLLGGAGRDRMLGQGGPDSLLGGGGVDRLQGGAGNDVQRQ